MIMMTVRKTSVFPASKEEIFRKLQRLKTLQYIAYPMATFTPVDRNHRLRWKEETASSYKFRLFGIIPFGIHTIRVIYFDLEKGIYTNESNTHVPVWNHKILIEKMDDKNTRYTDIVDIEAGWKTVFIYLWAVCFYSHRQRKWIELLKTEQYKIA